MPLFDVADFLREIGAVSLTFKFGNFRSDELNGCESFECGEPAEGWHHLVPRSHGGRKAVPLCGACHAKAHHSNANMNHRTLTKQGLLRAKARGVKLGSPKPCRWKGKANGWAEGQAKSCESRRKSTARAYENMLPTMRQMREEGKTVAEVAGWLNSQGFLTTAKQPFTEAAVWRILKRYCPEIAAIRRRKILVPA